MRDWLTLTRTPGLGSARAQRLLQDCGDARGILRAGASAWRKVGLSDAACAWLANPDETMIAADMVWLEQPGHTLLPCTNSHYPRALRDTPGAPPWLFAVGDTDLLGLTGFAIVGSRNPTSGGAEHARDFAATLAHSGLVIVSGLASGIDAAAHQGALDAQGMTIAVCGTGLDRVYPASNKALAGNIAASGLLVSEFALGTPATPGNFPRRNRIISGLSVGTLVVEAARQSGSLITARLAMEAGREVFAIPGSIHNPLARGCHSLIRDGAKLVESADDILQEIGPQLPSEASSGSPDEDVTTPAAPALDDDYQALLQVIDFGPTRVDTLIQRSGLTADAVSSMLLILELQGLVKATAGGTYTRIGA